MLVVTRKAGEEISIADGLITITVVRIQGDRVRVGINAPTDIPVHRKEIQVLLDAEKESQ